MNQNSTFPGGRACSTCRYWQGNIKTSLPDDADGGLCRYVAPVAGPSAWPETYPNDWCRHWRSEAERVGRPPKHTIENVLPVVAAILSECDESNYGDLYREVYARHPLANGTFSALLGKMVEAGSVLRVGGIIRLPVKTEEEV